MGPQECACPSVSSILLSPSGSWSKLEQMAVINLCLGNFALLKMLFSAHQSLILKMVREGLGINQIVSKACFCFSVLSSPVTLTIHLVKCGGICSFLRSVWKAVVSHNQWTGGNTPYECDSGALTCLRSTILSAFVALMLEAFTPRHWWSEWRGASDKVGNPHGFPDSLTFR